MFWLHKKDIFLYLFQGFVKSQQKFEPTDNLFILKKNGGKVFIHFFEKESLECFFKIVEIEIAFEIM